MIYSPNESTIERCEEYAPKRLSRCDVAGLRDLYRRAYEAPRVWDERGYSRWTAKHTIYLSRERRKRIVARLSGGRSHPCVELELQWSQIRSIGLNVDVTAHTGQMSTPHRSWSTDDLKLKIGTHRFRTDTTQQQFCRELSHLVRLGLGWCHENHSRLVNIL